MISDLFPKIDAPKSPDAGMLKAVKEVLKAQGQLQAEDTFVGKAVDLCVP